MRLFQILQNKNNKLEPVEAVNISHPWTIEAVGDVVSTQTYLKDILKSKTEAGEIFTSLAVLARSQTGGQGRHGRVWYSPAGNLYASFSIDTECPLEFTGQISLILGLSVAQVLWMYLGSKDNLRLKWPNDILVNNLKICGILTERLSHNGQLVAGIGVNIADVPLETSTCLKAHCTEAENSSPENVLNRILGQLHKNLQLWREDGWPDLKQAWLLLAHKYGETMQVKPSNTFVNGRFHGIDDTGALILETENGDLRTITAGEVLNG